MRGGACDIHSSGRCVEERGCVKALEVTGGVTRGLCDSLVSWVSSPRI